MKIGLFGGTFNPIHLGHLRAIREVSEYFELSKTLLIPAALPPHKPDQEIAAASDRLAMLRLAVGHVSGFEISDIELNRSGLSYTIDTVKQVIAATEKSDQVYLIMGIDAFLEIDTWKSFMALFQIVPIVIMARPDDTSGQTGSQWKAVDRYIKETLSAKYCYDPENLAYTHPEFQSIFLTNVSLLDISGTRIRNLIRLGKSIQFLVPEQIEHYIRKRGLYL